MPDYYVYRLTLDLYVLKKNLPYVADETIDTLIRCSYFQAQVDMAKGRRHELEKIATNDKDQDAILFNDNMISTEGDVVSNDGYCVKNENTQRTGSNKGCDLPLERKIREVGGIGVVGGLGKPEEAVKAENKLLDLENTLSNTEEKLREKDLLLSQV